MKSFLLSFFEAGSFQEFFLLIDSVLLFPVQFDSVLFNSFSHRFYISNFAILVIQIITRSFTKLKIFYLVLPTISNSERTIFNKVIFFWLNLLPLANCSLLTNINIFIYRLYFIHWCTKHFPKVSKCLTPQFIFLLCLARNVVPVPISRLATLLNTSLPINKYNISSFIKLTVPIRLSCRFQVLNTKVFILLPWFYVLSFTKTLNFHGSLINLVQLDLNCLADS